MSISSTRRLKRPSCILVNSSSSATMPVSLSASLDMMCMPRRESPCTAGSYAMVSAQPVIAVSGVRSSCDTCEMNSVRDFSATATFSDMSFISAVRLPSSFSYLSSIFMP